MWFEIVAEVWAHQFFLCKLDAPRNFRFEEKINKFLFDKMQIFKWFLPIYQFYDIHGDRILSLEGVQHIYITN